MKPNMGKAKLSLEVLATRKPTEQYSISVVAEMFYRIVNIDHPRVRAE
jgi:hypothetical protein